MDDRKEFFHVVEMELYGHKKKKKEVNVAFEPDDEDEGGGMSKSLGKFVNFGLKQLDNLGSVAASATEAAVSKGMDLTSKVIPGTSDEPVAMTTTYAARPVQNKKDTTERFGLQIGLSCVVTFCCNPVFGLAAFILAMLAGKISTQDRNKARHLAKTSLGISIIGIIVSIVAVVLAIGIHYGYLEKHCTRIINGDCYTRN